MTKATALKVADLLGLTEEYLKLGRPRKMPGKPRPEAIDYVGNPMKVIKKTDYWMIDKVSLVGAVKFAAYDQDYSKRVRDIAEAEICEEAWSYAGIWTGTLSGLDANIYDTRELRRIIRSTRRRIERSFDL